MVKKIITVTVEGGIIQAITGIPEDVEVHVMDFDCDSEPEDAPGNVRENEDGDCYWFSVWRDEC